VVDYNYDTSDIIIRSPVFITPELCQKVLKAQNRPFIAKYNPTINKVDVKGDPQTYNELKNNVNQEAKIEALIKHDTKKNRLDNLEFRIGPEAQGLWSKNPMIYNVRKISDYYYAADVIKKICDQVGAQFQDLDVIIGPIEQFFGLGVEGGFLGAQQFIKANKEIPFEIMPGLWVNPPVIWINSITMPSYASQTSTLIHEYRHFLFEQQYPDYKKQYGEINAAQGTPEYYRQWYLYLTDKNEVAAHKAQIKYDLLLGRSVDEIIREKIGDRITDKNYRVALKFKELVEETAKEIEEEGNNNENIAGTK
jgi:hypothetical protein